MESHRGSFADEIQQMIFLNFLKLKRIWFENKFDSSKIKSSVWSSRLYTYPCCSILQFLPASIPKNGATWSGDRLTSSGRSRLWSHSNTTESPTEWSERFARSNTTCNMADLTGAGNMFSWPWNDKIRKKKIRKSNHRGKVLKIRNLFFCKGTTKRIF